MFENRTTYRSQHQKKGLVSFEITIKETNLNIQARKDLSKKAIQEALKYRNFIENHINKFPAFATSLSPLSQVYLAPAIITDMIDAGKRANVGPMAAVAGAMAQYVGEGLLTLSKEVVVENGGDIFIKSDSETLFSIYAGTSPLSMTTGILVEKRETGFGMCTSSGSLGHSKSFGRADAASVVADSCALADAAATALCNMVQKSSDIEKAIHAGKQIQGIQGIVIIKGKHIGLWGDLKLVRLSP
ncbi:MAG: hypothetical protein B6230_00035 [Desulfobacteraceae bacterium 4572_89]|nr:MAG: hypothetical protein B6230_00035 [Desulfobacteraceae bacterium 4572_89]